jgi:serine/threonine protein kinase
MYECKGQHWSASNHNLTYLFVLQSSRAEAPSGPEKIQTSSAPGAETKKATFRDKYTTSTVLGQGSFSVVKLGVRKADGKKVAVKIVSRNKLQKEDEMSLRIEVEVLMSLTHPNIVQVLDFFEEPEQFYVVLEYLEGGELFDRLLEKAVYNEGEARDTFTILLKAIKYCHDLEVVHRDIKPENILLTSRVDDVNLKLADFGFAMRTGEVAAKRLAGTPGYIAPEIVLRKAHGTTVYTVHSSLSVSYPVRCEQANRWICGHSAWCCSCFWAVTLPSTSPRTTRRLCTARS